MKKLSGKIELLSKEELKKLIGGFGGSGEGGSGEGGYCAISTSCSLYIRELGQTYSGSCYYQLFGKCFCGVEVNGHTYTTDPSTTSVCYKTF